MKIINIILCVFCISTTISGQQYIQGLVQDENSIPLVNASIHWSNTNIGTITDENGVFQIIKTTSDLKKLVCSFIGFNNDTININDEKKLYIIKLSPLNSLITIDVTENRPGTYIDNTQTIKTEIITPKELTKAACCDLAGCFETQLSVESKTTNIITNTKELSILGLSGTYNQVLIDGIPIVNGATYTYGISSIPGTLIDNIHISQGLSSVLQGHESISGQINISLKNPNEKTNSFLNLYINSFFNKQINTYHDFTSGKWQSIIAFHSSQPGHKVDENKDNFLDLPLTTKYSLYNKWIYGSPNQEGIYSIITLRYLNEQRVGGEIDFDPDSDFTTDNNYGQKINFNQPEIHIKSSYKRNNYSFFLQSALSYHDQKSFFGPTEYVVQQSHLYLKLGYKLNWKTHIATSGFSIKNLTIDEEIIFNTNSFNTYDGIYKKNEQIPGLFIENTFKWGENIELITGVRVDQHNIHGILTTPRTLLKYNFSENTIARANLGKGWKTINLFSENIGLFGSNENIIISSNLKPEKATNFGINFLHAIYLENTEIQFIIDGYKTIFENQIFPDYHTNQLEIIVDNFEEKSVSNSFQAEIGMELIKEIGFKLAYNYLDVFRMIHGHKHRLPFISKHHILYTFSYHPINNNWHLDLNVHWFGPKKVFDTSINPLPFQRESESESYSIVNAQFTHKLNNLDFYIGCENILNFTQKDPIISANDPSSPYFNTSNIWGPTRGRELYAGVRILF